MLAVMAIDDRKPTRKSNHIPAKVKLAHENMMRRCTDRNHPDYPRYGGVGILVSSTLRDVGKFYEHVGDPPTPAHTLDRIRCDGHYFEGNLRWATRKEQQNNRRIQVKYPYKGEFLTSTELAERLGMSGQALRKRLRSWTFEEVIEKPKRAWRGK